MVCMAFALNSVGGSMMAGTAQEGSGYSDSSTMQCVVEARQLQDELQAALAEFDDNEPQSAKNEKLSAEIQGETQIMNALNLPLCSDTQNKALRVRTAKQIEWSRQAVRASDLPCHIWYALYIERPARRTR